MFKAIRRVRAKDLTRDLECEPGDCFELLGSMDDDFILVRRLDRDGTGYVPRSAVI
jgi:hypothetical protein